MVYLNLQYQKNCAIRPIVPSVVGGCLFTAFDLVSAGSGGGGGLSMQQLPRRLALYTGAMYVYSVLQCPMEAIHERQSAWHNVFSGGILGYIGVSRRILGIPFVDAYFFMRHPQISPPMAAAAVYGTMGGVLAAVLGDKRF